MLMLGIKRKSSDNLIKLRKKVELSEAGTVIYQKIRPGLTRQLKSFDVAKKADNSIRELYWIELSEVISELKQRRF